MSKGLIGHGIVNPIQVISVLELTTTPPTCMPRGLRSLENVVRNGTFWLPQSALAIVNDSFVPVADARADIITGDHKTRWYGFGIRREEGFVLPTKAHGVILVRNWPDARLVAGSESRIWPHHEIFFRAPDHTPEREMLVWAYLKSEGVNVTEIAVDGSPVIAGHSVDELLQPENVERLIIRAAALTF